METKQSCMYDYGDDLVLRNQAHDMMKASCLRVKHYIGQIAVVLVSVMLTPTKAEGVDMDRIEHLATLDLLGGLVIPFHRYTDHQYLRCRSFQVIHSVAPA